MSNPQTVTNHVIPEYAHADLTRRVNALNMRATKLGMAQIVVTVTGEEIRPNHARDEWGRPSSKLDGTFSTWLHVQIAGDDPVVAGWRFVAQLEHHDAGNVIRNLSNAPLPDLYRQSEANCDHCRLYRLRAMTYVLVSEAGEYKQVGSSCLADFTGHADPHAYADYLAAIADLSRDLDAYAEDPDQSGGYGKRLIPTELYLCHVAAIVRVHGWLGKGKAQDLDQISTSERASDNLLPTPYTDHSTLIEPTDADIALLQTVRQWVLASTDSSEYAHNLRVVCSEDYVDFRNLGLLASAIASYTKAHEVAIDGAASTWIGTPKSKIVNLPVTVQRLNVVDGSFGPTTVVTMQSQADILTWFASGEHEYTIGGCYLLSGTVKAHDTYKGTKQTIVTRCKLQEA